MPALPPKLNRIVAGDLCAGCGLCAAVAGPERLRMQISPHGFLRPVPTGSVPDEQDALIAEVCPGNRVAMNGHDGSFDPDWGPVVEVMTGHARDEELRFLGSSGGALSALLLHLLDSGAVDGVLQTAADPAAPLRNASQLSTGRAQVVGAAGSRYAPSAPLEALLDRLDRPERLAFVGKPCDVDALRAYARHDPRVDERLPIVISFMCGGIPSEAGTKEIVRQLGMAEEDLAEFRYRGRGWPGKTRAVTRDGAVEEMTYARAWGDILSKHLQLRCKICPDATGMQADVVCADAWYGDARGYPSFEERDGRSLIVARTRKGRALVEAAERSGALATEPLPLREIDRMQPFQARRRRLVLSRLAAMALMRRPVPRFEGLRLGRAARLAGIAQQLRSGAGMLRRLALGKA